MQSKKKNPGRIASRERANPRVSRTQKKTSENVQVGEKKVTELITSVARKQRFAETLPRNDGEPIPEINVNDRCNSKLDETSNDCFGCDVIDGASMDEKACYEENACSLLEKIASGVDFIKFFQSGDEKFYRHGETEYLHVDIPSEHHTGENFDPTFGHGMKLGESTIMSISATCPSNIEDAKNFKNSDAESCSNQRQTIERNPIASCCNEDSGVGLSPEVSAIYLAMKNSKLECVDEHGQDSMSPDCYVEDDDCMEFDDFDPYLFIKNLPDLSSVVHTFRRVLLPKQTRSCPPTTLVLDLDETLVHSTLEPCDDADFTFSVNFNSQEHTVYVRCRPHLRDFMERVSSLFEIIIFTASQSIYAEQLLNVLDPKRKVFRHRVYRESCVFVEGNYLKDLSILGRDLAHVIIVDNSPQAFGFQVDNGIPIESWFDDRSDQELLLLLPFLESLIGVEDVRPLIAKKFNLREKIAAAVTL